MCEGLKRTAQGEAEYGQRAVEEGALRDTWDCWMERVGRQSNGTVTEAEYWLEKREIFYGMSPVQALEGAGDVCEAVRPEPG